VTAGDPLAQSVAQAEARCRAARTLESLAFVIANETWQVLRYRQALVWRDGVRGPGLLAVSGLATLGDDSPFTIWVRRFVRALWPQLASQHDGGAALFDLADPQAPLPPAREGWNEWWPPHLAVVPLVQDGVRLGAALFLFEQPLSAAEQAVLVRLQATWSYCAWAVAGGKRRRAPWRPTRRLGWAAAVLAVGALCIPVRQSVLAPAEIVALKAVAVAAPIEGVVQTFHVHPNQAVKAGQPLFSLDGTTLRNRREITARALEVAGAELLSAQQKAFDDPKARAEVATLQGRIAERRAELRAVEEQLARIDVAAPREGVAVFGDVNDWQGKPVVTGERVLQLADPGEAGVMVYLPVADAIALEEGARMRIFLNVAPLSPLEAVLTETSYQAVLSPEGISAYRLRGALQGERAAARIGLKGTAKLYGTRVPLAYYLFRRPLAALRQWSGL
jgi:multidrug resistance efflux pump